MGERERETHHDEFVYLHAPTSERTWSREKHFVVVDSELAERRQHKKTHITSGECWVRIIEKFIGEH